MPTQTVTFKWARGSETFSQDVSYTEDGEVTADIPLPAGTTNQEISIAIPTLAKLKLWFALATQAITLKTNSSGSPVDTIAMTANNPLVYRSDDLRAALFSAPVTKIFATNASGVDTTLKIRIIIDITP